jgi:transposase, IS5 family
LRAKAELKPFALETVWCIHFVQQWLGICDLIMKKVLFDTSLYRDFMCLSGVEHIPARVSIVRKARRLTRLILLTRQDHRQHHGLQAGRFEGAVYGTLIAAINLTKNTTSLATLLALSDLNMEWY